MNDRVTVTEVLDNFAKHGHSDKTNKDWSMSRVGLSNGESAFVFNPIAVGDVVEAKENNGYKNWFRVNPKAQAENAKHDELVNRLDRIERLLGRIYVQVGGEVTPTPNTAQTAPTKPTGIDIARQARDIFRTKPDEVHPVNDNGDIDLNNIPF